jgi:ribosomal protein L22
MLLSGARTILVHNDVMSAVEKAVRQSVSLPPRLAKQVVSMARNRKLSKNRMLLELIENGIAAEAQKRRQFFALAERFRNEKDPEAADRLGDELGRMIFG